MEGSAFLLYSPEEQKIVLDVFNHRHGAPRQKRKYNKYVRPFDFHLKEELYLHLPTKTVMINPLKCLIEDCIAAKDILKSIRRDLGLKKGTVLIWKETNRWGKVVKHTLCFDGSGQDISFSRDLENLVNFSISTGLKGRELLEEFALKHSVGNYVSVFRGNKTIVTSSPERALKAYLRENLAAAQFD